MTFDLNELAKVIQDIKDIKHDVSKITDQLNGKQPETQWGGMGVWEQETGCVASTFYTMKSLGKIPSRIYKKQGRRKIIFNKKELREWVSQGKPTPAQEIAARHISHA